MKNIKDFTNNVWVVSTATGLIVYFFTAGLKPIGFASVVSILSSGYSRAVASSFKEAVVLGFLNYNSWIIWIYVLVLTRITIVAAVDPTNSRILRYIMLIVSLSTFLFGFYYNSVNSAALSFYKEYRGAILKSNSVDEKDAARKAMDVEDLSEVKKFIKGIQ